MQITEDLRTSLSEFSHGIWLVAHGETSLFRKEGQNTIADLRKLFVLFPLLFAAGAVCCLFGSAFAVIGLGKLLGGRYWLSALIFFATSSLIALAITIVSFRKLLDVTHRIRRLGHQVTEEAETLKRQLKQFRDDEAGSTTEKQKGSEAA